MTNPNFDRKRAAQRLDLLGQAIAAIGRVDQWQQRIAELDLQVVHLERACDRFVRGIGFGGGFGFLCLGGGGEFCPLVDNEGEGACPSAECQKRNHGNARQKRHEQRELLQQRFVGRTGVARFRNQQASRGRNDQRGQLCDQTITNRKDRVGMSGIGKRKALLRDTDDHPADDVDEDNQQACNCIAANEFGGAVHGAEESAFVFQCLPAPPRFLFVDKAGRQVRVDCHLLARHGVKVEARGNFGDTARTLRDDDKVHEDQDREHDDPDDKTAAHHEISERFDHMTGVVGAFMPTREHQPRGRKVERQPQHGRDQQHGREG